MIVLPFAIASDGNASAASGAGADRAWLKLHTAAARPPAMYYVTSLLSLSEVGDLIGISAAIGRSSPSELHRHACDLEGLSSAPCVFHIHPRNFRRQAHPTP